MSLFTKLVETYNNCEQEHLAQIDMNKRPLLPKCHTTRAAQLEIIIDSDGNFLDARAIDKTDALTIVAATEISDTRTGEISPHALNDVLTYIAGDLCKYCTTEKKLNEKHVAYMEQLTSWCNSQYANDKVKSVLTYLKKNTVMKDIISIGLVILDENNRINNKPNNPSPLYKVCNEIQKAFCRFTVQFIGDVVDETHKDVNVHNSWIDYCNSHDKKEGLCYISGKRMKIANKHPKFIRYSGDSAKLISANDEHNFTYRGMFTSPEQACSIGEETSQKAHAALKWLIDRQAYKRYDHTILAWTTQNSPVLNPISDEDYFSGNFEQDFSSETGDSYANKICKFIAGYKQNIKPNELINIVAFDSATPGRLSVIYYCEKDCHEYLDKLQKWYTSFSWLKRLYVKVSKRFFYGESTPTPREIAFAAYTPKKSDDKIYHATIERLLPCIVDGQQIPKDLVINAVNKASNPQAFETETAWENVLVTACALYRKLNDKEDYKMSLDYERNTRDYLFGRLLAVADSIESWALRDGGENRSTTAMRYFSRFSVQPYATWKIIEENLMVYVDKLRGKAFKYTRVIDEIMSKFETSDFVSSRALSGEYLLGYHNQRHEFFNHNTKENE